MLRLQIDNLNLSEKVRIEIEITPTSPSDNKKETVSLDEEVFGEKPEPKTWAEKMAESTDGLPPMPGPHDEVFVQVGIPSIDVFANDPFRRQEDPLPLTWEIEKAQQEKRFSTVVEEYKPKRSIKLPASALVSKSMPVRELSDLYYDVDDPVNALKPGQKIPQAGPHHVKFQCPPPLAPILKKKNVTEEFK